MPRPALLLLPLLLAGCAAAGGGGDPQADSRLAWCRAEATRLVQFRDRGQTMRADETESGRGTVTVAPFTRAESDRAGAQMERDRLVAECMRSAAEGPPR